MAATKPHTYMPNNTYACHTYCKATYVNYWREKPASCCGSCWCASCWLLAALRLSALICTTMWSVNVMYVWVCDNDPTSNTSIFLLLMLMLWLVSNALCQNNSCCNLILTLGHTDVASVVCTCAVGKLAKFVGC